MRAPAGRLAVLLALTATGAAAEDLRLAPDAFAALLEGRTASWSLDGRHYGRERFGEGRRSTHQYPGGRCQEGVWWDEPGDVLCFRYGSRSCWTVHREADGDIYAMTVDRTLRLDLESIDDGPLNCDGEPVG